MNASTPRVAIRAPLVPDLRDALLDTLGAPSLDTRPVLLVTPTPALGRDLVAAHARRHGWTLVRTSGVRELSVAIAARERAQERRGLLGVEARSWLVRRLQRARDRGATSFDAVLEVRGFRTALLHAFEELGWAGLASATAIERQILRHGLDLPREARHVLELAVAWRRSFEAHHDDPAGLVQRAADAPPGRAREVAGDRIWWFGFDALGALERRLCRALAADPNLDLRFFVPEDEIESPADLEPFLADVGFGLDRPPVRSTPLPADLRALACPSAESEAEEIARTLLAAAEAGMPFERMGVVVPHTLRLERLRETLLRRRIPCVFHPGRALRTTRAGRAFLFFLDLLDGPLALEPGLDFLSVAPLRTGWGGIEADHTPSRWERAAREAGVVVGKADWTTKLERYAESQTTAAASRDLESEPSVRARAAAQAARDLAAVVTALDAERTAFAERGRWQERVEAADAFLGRVFESSAEVDALRAALGRLRALDALATTGVSRGEFRDTVRTLLAETHAESERTAGVVRAGTAAALEGLDFDLVCVAGVQEGEWPLPPPSDPVLRERERAALAAVLPAEARLAAPDEAVERARRQFWRACRSARQRLVVSWARLDPVTGAACLPSSLVLELAARREGRPIDYDTILALPWVERVPLRRTALPESMPELGVDEIDVAHVLGLEPVAARRYVYGLGECARRGLGIDRARHQVPRFTNADGILSARAARVALAARYAHPSFSATQLGRYASCPFRSFLHDVLRLEPLDRDDRRDLSGLEAGRIAHRILESFYATLVADGRRLAALEPAEVAARLHAAAEPVCGDAEAAGRTGAPLLWSIRKQRLLEDLRRYLRRTRLQTADRFQPVAFESRFGRGTAQPVTLRISERETIGLHGVLDRLDCDPEGACRVVDYKTGRVQDRDRDPSAVQLAVYLWAVTGGDPARLQASEARCVSVTRRGGFAARRLEGARLDAQREDFRAFVGGVVDGIRGGEFPPTPGKGAQRCLACDYQPLCEAGIAEQWERKSASGQLEAHTALPDPNAWLAGEDG